MQRTRVSIPEMLFYAQLVSSRRMSASFAALLILLFGLSFLCTGCEKRKTGSDAGGAESAREVIVSFGTRNGVRLKPEEVEFLISSVRRRLIKLGFERVEVKAARPRDELLIGFASSPATGAPGELMKQAFSRPGLLDLRRLHPESAALVKSLKLFARVGPEWTVARDQRGGQFVVGWESHLNPRYLGGVKVTRSVSGEGFDVSVILSAQGVLMLDEAKAGMAGGSLALLLDGKVLGAPLPPIAAADRAILVNRGVSEAEARERAFALEAPFVVPLQIKSEGAM